LTGVKVKHLTGHYAPTHPPTNQGPLDLSPKKAPFLLEQQKSKESDAVHVQQTPAGEIVDPSHGGVGTVDVSAAWLTHRWWHHHARLILPV